VEFTIVIEFERRHTTLLCFFIILQRRMERLVKKLFNKNNAITSAFSSASFRARA